MIPPALRVFKSESHGPTGGSAARIEGEPARFIQNFPCHVGEADKAPASPHHRFSRALDGDLAPTTPRRRVHGARVVPPSCPPALTGHRSTGSGKFSKIGRAHV